MEDRCWQDWVADFTSEGTRFDPGVVAARVRRSSLVMVLETALTVGICLGLTGLLVYRIWVAPHPVVIAISAVVIAFVAVSAVVFFRVRQGAWRAAEQTPRALVALLRRRESSRLREARFSMKSSIALGLAVTLWIPWRLWVDWDGYCREPWRAVVGVGGIYVLLAVALFATRLWMRRRARALDILLEMERSFETGEENGGER
ncbi:MAG TPA: hypothetical protein VM285_06380 [Polyangia bacterium]|nr:hypothetical protein [Polyangia bacterium]